MLTTSVVRLVFALALGISAALAHGQIVSHRHRMVCAAQEATQLDPSDDLARAPLTARALSLSHTTLYSPARSPRSSAARTSTTTGTACATATVRLPVLPLVGGGALVVRGSGRGAG